MSRLILEAGGTRALRHDPAPAWLADQRALAFTRKREQADRVALLLHLVRSARDGAPAGGVSMTPKAGMWPRVAERRGMAA